MVFDEIIKTPLGGKDDISDDRCYSFRSYQLFSSLCISTLGGEKIESMDND